MQTGFEKKKKNWVNLKIQKPRVNKKNVSDLTQQKILFCNHFKKSFYKNNKIVEEYF